MGDQLFQGNTIGTNDGAATMTPSGQQNTRRRMRQSKLSEYFETDNTDVKIFPPKIAGPHITRKRKQLTKKRKQLLSRKEMLLNIPVRETSRNRAGICCQTQ